MLSSGIEQVSQYSAQAQLRGIDVIKDAEIGGELRAVVRSGFCKRFKFNGDFMQQLIFWGCCHDVLLNVVGWQKRL